LRTEHRLTRLESKSAEHDRQHREHGRQIMELKRDRKPPTFSLRDWFLSAAGIAVVLAALLKKIPVSEALSLLSNLN
jgi:hypothetical protein